MEQFSNHMSVEAITLLVLHDAYNATKYENTDDAKAVFKEIEIRLPVIATKDTAGMDIFSKFSSFANTVADQENFKDLVKIAWRMVKQKSGQPQYKLCLFIIAISAIIFTIIKKPSLKPKALEWMNNITDWLGNQLTIGGKGVTGIGDGNVIERLKRFFSTPYLHDFD